MNIHFEYVNGMYNIHHSDNEILTASPSREGIRFECIAANSPKATVGFKYLTNRKTGLQGASAVHSLKEWFDGV
jgi:hypothetical protein